MLMKLFGDVIIVELTQSSVYRVCNETIVNHDEDTISGDWLKHWNLLVSPNVKIFMWRLRRDILPMRSRLNVRVCNAL
jgi:hypothetical protein